MEVTNKIGRRKTSVARIYLEKGNGNITVNNKDYKVYFPTLILQQAINKPFVLTDNVDKYDVNVNVSGGGIAGQANAIKMAIARALVEINPEAKSILKPDQLLTRDPRMVERKKPGQKKARKRFQFSKR